MHSSHPLARCLTLVLGLSLLGCQAGTATPAAEGDAAPAPGQAARESATTAAPTLAATDPATDLPAAMTRMREQMGAMRGMMDGGEAATPDRERLGPMMDQMGATMRGMSEMMQGGMMGGSAEGGMMGGGMMSPEAMAAHMALMQEQMDQMRAAMGLGSATAPAAGATAATATLEELRSRLDALDRLLAELEAGRPTAASTAAVAP